MVLQLDFHAQAQKDIIATEAYYGSISDPLAERFMSDLERTFDLITQHPKGFQLVADGFRQAPLDHFPFVIIYQIVDVRIAVFRIFHTSQDPDKKYSAKA